MQITVNCSDMMLISGSLQLCNLIFFPYSWILHSRNQLCVWPINEEETGEPSGSAGKQTVMIIIKKTHIRCASSAPWEMTGSMFTWLLLWTSLSVGTSRSLAGCRRDGQAAGGAGESSQLHRLAHWITFPAFYLNITSLLVNSSSWSCFLCC